MEKSKSGWIVHPNWTGNSKYHAAYGSNVNKTNKSFNTQKEAKAYLKSKGVTEGTKKTESGHVTKFKTTATKSKRRYTRKAPTTPNWFGW